MFFMPSEHYNRIIKIIMIEIKKRKWRSRKAKINEKSSSKIGIMNIIQTNNFCVG